MSDLIGKYFEIEDELYQIVRESDFDPNCHICRLADFNSYPEYDEEIWSVQELVDRYESEDEMFNRKFVLENHEFRVMGRSSDNPNKYICEELSSLDWFDYEDWQVDQWVWDYEHDNLLVDLRSWLKEQIENIPFDKATDMFDTGYGRGQERAFRRTLSYLEGWVE